MLSGKRTHLEEYYRVMSIFVFKKVNFLVKFFPIPLSQKNTIKGNSFAFKGENLLYLLEIFILRLRDLSTYVLPIHQKNEPN